MLIMGIYLNNSILMLVGSFSCGIYECGLARLGFLLTCESCSENLTEKGILIQFSFWGIT